MFWYIPTTNITFLCPHLQDFHSNKSKMIYFLLPITIKDLTDLLEITSVKKIDLVISHNVDIKPFAILCDLLLFFFFFLTISAFYAPYPSNLVWSSYWVVTVEDFGHVMPLHTQPMYYKNSRIYRTKLMSLHGSAAEIWVRFLGLLAEMGVN